MTVKKATNKSRKLANLNGKSKDTTPRMNYWTGRTPVEEWIEHATLEDVRKIAWKCVFNVQKKKLTPKQGGTMLYGLNLIKETTKEIMEIKDFERRLTELESNRGSNDGVISISVTK